MIGFFRDLRDMIDRTSQARAGIIGAVACTTIFAMTIGLTYPLISFVLKSAGYGETAIGFSAAMTPVGVLVASPFYPRVIQRLGAWNVAVVCLLLSAFTLLVLGTTSSFLLLLGLRFVLGVVDVGVYVVSETWINQLAAPKARGRIIGLYATSLSAGFGIGPLILSFTGFETYTPFAIGAGFCIAAAFTLLFIRRSVPSFIEDSPTSSWSFMKMAPTLLLAIAVYAFWESALLSLFPVYGLEQGLEARFVTFAIAVCIFGNTFLQIPLGWASDLTSRRATLIFCAVLGVAGTLAIPKVIQLPSLLFPILFVWGAVAGGLYTMAMAELGDRFEGPNLVAGNAAFAMAFGVGGIIGGPATGATMDVFGPNGFFVALGLVFFSAAVLGFVRRNRT